MPVSIPISCSIETRSSVAMLPVAPGGTGQPPSSPKLDSKDSTPASSAASTLARPWPRVLWKWAVSSTSPPAPRGRRRRSRAPGAGLAMPVVSPKPISCAPASRSRPAISNTRSGGTCALVGAAEGGRDHALAAQAGLAAGAGEHGLEPAQRLLDRAVDVLAVVGLAGAEEDVDLLEALALAERVSSPLSLGISTEIATSSGGSMRSSTSLGVGELRDHVGAHEARRPRGASGRCGRARRSAAPCRRWGSSPARSGSRRAGRPRGCARAWDSHLAGSNLLRCRRELPRGPAGRRHGRREARARDARRGRRGSRRDRQYRRRRRGLRRLRLARPRPRHVLAGRPHRRARLGAARATRSRSWTRCASSARTSGSTSATTTSRSACGARGGWPRARG